MIYPPVYMGINPSGTKTLNSSLFYVDSNLHKPDGWGEGRSCVEQGDLSISGGLRVQAPLTSKAFWNFGVLVVERKAMKTSEAIQSEALSFWNSAVSAAFFV